MARVLPYPWSLLSPRGDIGSSVSWDECELSDPLNAESITFFTHTDKETLPKIASQTATPITECVLWEPQFPTGRVPGVLSFPAWPHDRAGHWRVLIKDKERIISTQDRIIPTYGTLRRASAWEDPTDSNAAEVSFRDTIDLLCGYFTEAISLTQDREFAEFREFAGQIVSRLNWAMIWKRWKKVSSGDEPRMARVVEIAFAHLTAIQNVCERPRRMLVRQREPVPVGRVQELDSVCLRDLIRRPGRTVLEKAGARQEILAITRRETVDTAENRVMREFIRLCQHRARAYEREHGRAREHPRVRTVVVLRSNCERLEVRSPLSTVGRLLGVPRPNYVLQKDRRYHPLWVQYDKLRREEEAVDNIWSWGRRLWAEFVRGVVISFLQSEEAENTCGWRLDGELPCYLRTEHQAGSFISALSVSSRWIRRDRRARMLLVHPAHAHLCPGLEEILPRLGVELALVVYPAAGSSKPEAILCIYSVLSLGTDAKQRDAMIVSLRSSLDQVAEQKPGLNVRALLLRGEWQRDKQPENPRYGRVDYLAAPAGSPFWFDLEDGFPYLLRILLEELAE